MKQEAKDKLKSLADQAGQREVSELLYEAYNLGLDDEWARVEAHQDRLIKDIESGEYRKYLSEPEQGGHEEGIALDVSYIFILVLALMFLFWVLQNQ
jgi:hypothetical protein